ncbi:MAG: hypothetical protein QOJ98_3616, partial [Acidobacteriota bacterium]|nr:hypothetical protein [Acidobacteriota bacterium]
MTLLNLCPNPRYIVWDLTYACPLRCSHCYAEAGRRAAMEMRPEDMLRVIDALISLQPTGVMLSGGEPLLVKAIFDIAKRLTEGGVEVLLYTGGWVFEPEMVEPILNLFSRVSVSIDGATAEVHDRIRGRAGSFDRALNALSLLDRGARERREKNERSPWIGVDYVVMQSNVHQLRDFCRDIAPRFPGLDFISFGSVIPSGLATRVEFVEHEMLSEEQTSALGAGELERELQAMVPEWLEVTTTDNQRLQMRPDLLIDGIGMPALHVEPDGQVRAMCSYEGTVGNLLQESPALLWQRALERLGDPFVLEALTPVRTTKEWA